LSWLAIAMPLGYNYFGILGLLIAIALVKICPAIYVTIKLKMIGMIHIRKEVMILLPTIIGFCISKMTEILIK
jgi:hypothetical protein